MQNTNSRGSVLPEKAPKKPIDGLFMKNPVLISGLIAAPVIVCTTTLQNALLLCTAFSLITLFSVLLSLLVPQRFVYGVRIIVYALLAAVVYVPVSIVCEKLFAGTAASLGIYLPLLTANSMIIAQTEFLFDRRSKRRLPATLLCTILGFDLAVLLMSVIREFLCFGTIGGSLTGLPRTTQGLATPAGGFLLLGLLCVLTRKLRIVVRAAIRQRTSARHSQEDAS